MQLINAPDQKTVYILADIDTGEILDEFRTSSMYPARDAKKYFGGLPANQRIFIMLGDQEDWK